MSTRLHIKLSIPIITRLNTGISIERRNQLGNCKLQSVFNEVTYFCEVNCQIDAISNKVAFTCEVAYMFSLM